VDLDSELATLREEIKGKAEEHDAETHNAQAAQAEDDVERWLQGQGFLILETMDWDSMTLAVSERGWQDEPSWLIIAMAAPGYASWHRVIRKGYGYTSYEALPRAAVKEELWVLHERFPILWDYMRVTAMSVGVLMEIVGLNCDPYPAIPVRAILLSQCDLNLVPWALVNGELALFTYCRDSIRAPYQIHMLLELTEREEAISPELTLDAEY